MYKRQVDNFNNDKIGLIVFAGDAFVQLPITSDIGSLCLDKTRGYVLDVYKRQVLVEPIAVTPLWRMALSAQQTEEQ